MGHSDTTAQVASYVGLQQQSCSADWVSQLRNNGTSDEDIQKVQAQIDQLKADINQKADWNSNQDVPTAAAKSCIDFCDKVHTFVPTSTPAP